MSEFAIKTEIPEIYNVPYPLSWIVNNKGDYSLIYMTVLWGVEKGLPVSNVIYDADGKYALDSCNWHIYINIYLTALGPTLNVRIWRP